MGGGLWEQSGPRVPWLTVCISLWAPLGSSWLLTSNPATGGSFTDQLCAFVALGQAGPCSLRQVGWSKECMDTQLGEPGKLSYLPRESRADQASCSLECPREASRAEAWEGPRGLRLAH